MSQSSPGAGGRAVGTPRLVVCPGFHPPHETDQMLADMAQYPAFQGLLPWRSPTVLSGSDLRQALEAAMGDPGGSSPPLIFLAFSAGCVAATSVAHYWQVQGGQVLALFALDGFGVPLGHSFPVHRLSHDRFTHVTSALLGTGRQNFYADPAVPHRQLWQRPSQIWGWQLDHSLGQPAPGYRTTAGACLASWLAVYGP